MSTFSLSIVLFVLWLAVAMLYYYKLEKSRFNNIMLVGACLSIIFVCAGYVNGMYQDQQVYAAVEAWGAEPADPEYVYKGTNEYQHELLRKAVGLRSPFIISLSGAREKAD